MTVIFGGNNPRNAAHVDENGRLSAFAVSLSEQQKASEQGENFNLNTDELTLTSDAETPLFYIKNTGEERGVKINRLFSTFLASTGGTGKVILNVYSNITGGTILTGDELPIYNFNFGSGKVLDVETRIGATGLTFSGGEKPITSLFPSDGIRQLTAFDHIILPRGASMLVTIVPPAGNTSMIAEAGCNLFLEASAIV